MKGNFIKCPHCNSQEVSAIKGNPKYDSGNIFGFKLSDYRLLPRWVCTKCKFRWNSSQNFKISKWLKELKEIHDKVFFLNENNKYFHQLVKDFNSKKLDFEIFRFCRRNYVTFMAMAVRRLIDRDNRTISLIKILDDLYKNSEAFTRKWFLKQFPGAENESLFKKFFGSGESLNKEVVESDIQKLIFITKKIKDFADKWEAHWDKKRFKVTTPNFNDLDMAVIRIVAIYKKYYYLLKQSSISF